MLDYISQFHIHINKCPLSLPEVLKNLFESSASPFPLDKGHFCPFDAYRQIIRLPLPFGDWSSSQLKFIFDWYGLAGRSAYDSKLVRAAIKRHSTLIVPNWQTDVNVQDEFRRLWKQNAGIAVPIFIQGNARGVLIAGIKGKLTLPNIEFLQLVAKRLLIPYIRSEDNHILKQLLQRNIFNLDHFELLLEHILRATTYNEKGVSFERLAYYILSTIEGIQIITTRDLRSTGEVDILVLNNSSHPFWLNKSKEIVIECKNLNKPISGGMVRNIYAMCRLMNINSSIIFSRLGLTTHGKGSGLEVVTELMGLGFRIVVVSLKHIQLLKYGISPSDMLQKAEDDFRSLKM